MAATIRFIYGTEDAILSLSSSSENWVERAFYYPEDKTYFYQALNGQMKRYGGGDIQLLSVGITLDGRTIGGVKTHIEPEEVLDIPVSYDYNTFSLTVSGDINCNGQINIM
jgi:hypothetical protein